MTVSPTNPGEGRRSPRGGGDQGRLRRPAAHDHGPRPRFSFVGPCESIDVKVELPTGSRASPPRLAVGRSAPAAASAPPASRARWPWTSTPPATSGCAPRTATRQSRAPTAASRSRPTTVRSGSARSPATRSSRRRTARSRSRVRRRRRGQALVRRPRHHEGARLGRGQDRVRRIGLGEVSSGSIQVESGYGEITIGVRPGVPAWLDLSQRTDTCATSF